MNLVLDSGVIIALTAGEKDKSLVSIEKILDLTRSGSFKTYISSITISEIYAHFYKKNDPRKAVEACTFLEEINVVSIDMDKKLAKNSGILKSKYRISFADAIILATCIDLETCLITYDREFSVVRDVVIFKPEEFTEFLNAQIKMKCSCGGDMKEIYKEIESKKTKVAICDSCRKELIDVDHAVKSQKNIRRGPED